MIAMNSRFLGPPLGMIEEAEDMKEEAFRTFFPDP
jgi:hypothetical protein